MSDMRYAVKDSVFTYLFKQPEYTRLLYLSLHPEDTDVTEEDCKLVTLENILTTGLYNDLGIQIRDKLILLVEAQSTFSVNIVLRMLLYLAATYKEYVEEQKLDLYSSKPVKVPRPELYVIYTGSKKDVPNTLRLSDLYEGPGSVDLTVKVLRGNDKRDIVDQYVRFCQIADQKRQTHGRTAEAARETIRQCMEEGILVPFLASRQKEVEDIMVTLFDQEKVWEIHDYNARAEAKEAGRAEGKEEGIQATVSSLKKFNVSKAAVVEQLIEEFSLLPNVAKNKVEQYWGS